MDTVYRYWFALITGASCCFFVNSYTNCLWLGINTISHQPERTNFHSVCLSARKSLTIFPHFLKLIYVCLISSEIDSVTVMLCVFDLKLTHSVSTFVLGWIFFFLIGGLDPCRLVYENLHLLVLELFLNLLMQY